MQHIQYTINKGREQAPALHWFLSCIEPSGTGWRWMTDQPKSRIASGGSPLT